MAKARHLVLLRRHYTSPLKTLARSARLLCSDSSPEHPRDRDRDYLLTEKPTTPFISDIFSKDIRARVSSLAEEILGLADARDVAGVLESRSAADLLRRSPSGFALLELVARLSSVPEFALEVFNWRRQAITEMPMLAAEYSKAIKLAGRLKNVNLAVDLFHDAVAINGIHSIYIYNALIVAYMYNGHTRKAISVFEDIKADPSCEPTIITYNIILSVFGRSLLVSQMESTFQTLYESDDLAPDLTTYNTVISGYVVAWEWDKMESTFLRMKAGPVKPDVTTHLLMLRGYTNSGNIEKMERSYELVKKVVDSLEVCFIRAMICAYCKSSDQNRVRKIENLMKLLPAEECRPWLTANLIRLYAQEGLVESLDMCILEALNRKTIVTSSDIMLSIIAVYFNSGAVDRLAEFIRQAEDSGWRLCRSLYHTKMVLYGQLSRLEEMHMVLDEMNEHRFHPTKKTFLILSKAYLKMGRRSEAESVIGLMWKHGFGTPEEFSYL